MSWNDIPYYPHVIESGKSLLPAFHFRNICRYCQELEPLKMILCNHIDDVAIAGHKDKSKQSLHKLICEAVGAEEAHQRESHGISTRPACSAFPQDKIDAILDKKRHVRIKPTDRIDEIVCTIDPNGGGSSRSAVMIGYLNKRTDNIVICQLDAYPTKDLDQLISLIRRNIEAFRDTFADLRNVPIRIVPESNSRFFGDVIYKEFYTWSNFFGESTRSNLGEIRFHRDSEREKIGTTKTYTSTLGYMLNMEYVLKQGKLRLHQNIQTASRVRSLNGLVNDFRSEMEQFVWPDRDPENPRLNSRKATGKIGGKNDDIAITALMLVYFGRLGPLIEQGMQAYKTGQYYPNETSYTGMTRTNVKI